MSGLLCFCLDKVIQTDYLYRRVFHRSHIGSLSLFLALSIVLLFLTGPLAYMPNAVLSSVVFLIGLRLIDLKGMSGIFRVSPEEFIVATITAVTVVVVGVEQGIILAIVLSIIIQISHSYKPSDATLVPMPRGHWQTTVVDQNKEAEPGLVVYFFGASLYFANAVRFSEEIVRLVDDAQPQVKWLDVDAAAMIGIDYTGADTIRQVHTILQKKGVTLAFSNVIDDVKKELDRYGLTKLVGKEHIYDSLPDVLAAYRKETKQVEEEPTS